MKIKYAGPKALITKDGIYTQGIYGFLNMIAKIKKDYNPKYMGVAWDLKKPTFRHQAYKDYKAGRKKMPLELAMEFPVMKEIFDAMNIPNLEVEGFEADDIIGTISRNCDEKDLETLVITGDKDALQLITDKTKVLFTKRGVSNFVIYDEKVFEEEFKITPKEFIDLKGLMGDKSDNIPGIPGIGQVKGTELIHLFGSVSNLVARVDEVSNKKLQEKIKEFSQQAILSRHLAEINRFVPIEFELENFEVKTPNYNKLIELYKKLEFNKFLKQLSEIEDIDIGNSTKLEEFEVKKIYKNKIETIIIDSNKDLNKLDDLKGKKELWIKVTSNNDHIDEPIISHLEIFSLSDDNKNSKYYLIKMIGVGEQESLLDIVSQDSLEIEEIIDKLNSLNLNISGSSMIENLYPLIFYGYKNYTLLNDIELEAYLLEPARKDYDISQMYLEYFQIELKDEKDRNPKGIDYFIALIQMHQVMISKLKKLDMLTIYNDVEMKLINVLALMEVSGIYADKKTFFDLGQELEVKINDLTSKIYKIAGEEFNINSPMQLGEILFEKMKLPFGKKTKRGYSTSADILNKIKDEYEIVALVLEYRTYFKLNSTYIQSMMNLIGYENKIRASFQQTVTATGRLSCTEPNLQNIPIRLEQGRQIRKAFLPSKGNVLLGADYSQIELRVLAHLSKDPILIKAFNDGADIHRITASEVFNINYEEITSEDRSKAKAVNFGIVYGMSSFGLSEELSIPIKEAESYIQKYFDRYSGVKKYMEDEVLFCKEKGYTKTILGRIRYIREINSSNYMSRQFGERLAMNTPIQGSAADIIKLAMIKVQKALYEGGYKAKLILQIHDELLIDCPKDEVEKVSKLLGENMEKVIKLDVPLIADVHIGNNWYELK